MAIAGNLISFTFQEMSQTAGHRTIQRKINWWSITLDTRTQILFFFIYLKLEVLLQFQSFNNRKYFDLWKRTFPILNYLINWVSTANYFTKCSDFFGFENIKEVCRYYILSIILNSGYSEFNWSFRSLEVVSRWRDPQLQVSENYSYLIRWKLTIFQILLIDVTFHI